MSEKMAEKEFVPFGSEIYVSDFDASMKFYKDILGFNLIRVDEGNHFAALEFKGAIFMFEEKPEWVQPTMGIVLRFTISDLESYYEQLKSRGVEIYKTLETKSYGATRFYIKDPDGYQLKFAGK